MSASLAPSSGTRAPRITPSAAASPSARRSESRNGRSQTNSLSLTRQSALPSREVCSDVSGSARASLQTSSKVAIPEPYPVGRKGRGAKVADVRDGQASQTARRVAAQRRHFPRLSTGYGDPAADQLLHDDVAGDLPYADTPFTAYLAARTRFFDLAVVDAIARGTQQIVVVGAGYEG